MTDSPTVEIVRRNGGEVVQATLLEGLKPPDLLVVEREWGPVRSELMQDLLSGNVPRREWPESLHWDWREKARELKLLASAGFGIVFEKRWQGAMLTKTASHVAQLGADRGKPLVYIDYLEVAPWNWNVKRLSQHGEFKGVGSVLMWKALQQSSEEGFHGRIGLHALPGAESFYEKFGMTPLGRDPAKQNLLYFELSRADAQRHLNEGGTS